MYKKLPASGGLRPPDPSPGALPLDPAGGSAPIPPFRLALRALAMVRPHLWQILDPPVAQSAISPKRLIIKRKLLLTPNGLYKIACGLSIAAKIYDLE